MSPRARPPRVTRRVSHTRMDDEARALSRSALNIMAVVGGYALTRLVVASVNTYQAFAAPDLLPDPRTGAFPAGPWVVLQVVIVFLAFLAGGFLASLWSQGRGIAQALWLSGIAILLGLPSILPLMASHRLFALGLLVSPVPGALAGSGLSRSSNARWGAGARPMGPRRALVTGAIVGVCVAWILLAFFHAGDPYYAGSSTARTVFWYAIVPGSLLSGGAVGAVCASVGRKLRKRQRERGTTIGG